MDRSLERFAGRILGVATMHEKERVIGPALMAALPLAGHRPIAGVDTDQFGAFSGEVQRRLDPLATCVEKAKHGALIGGFDLVVASEGSFGPYPLAPFISCDEEIIVLYDARDGMVFHYRHVSLEIAFGGERCANWPQVSAFAERMRFPEHRLVVRTKERWEQGDVLIKGISGFPELRQVTEEIQEQHGTCWVETDMRAMYNPTRMKVIAATAERFGQELATLCPVCGELWFRVTQAIPGLPCDLCGWPTESVRAFERSCRSCGYTHHVDRPDGKTHEAPQHCGHCNP